MPGNVRYFIVVPFDRQLAATTAACRPGAPVQPCRATLHLRRALAWFSTLLSSSPLRQARLPAVLHRVRRRGAGLHDTDDHRRVADGDADAVGADGRAGADREHRAVVAAGAVRRRAGGHRRPAAGDPGDADRPVRWRPRCSASSRCSARSTPATLLAFTFLIGAGFTFYMPAQSASINDLVARADVPRAVALGAVAFNVARAVGPALAGASLAWLGSGSALRRERAVLRRDDRRDARLEELRARAAPGIPETLLSGIESGLRYTRHSPPHALADHPQRELRAVRERGAGRCCPSSRATSSGSAPAASACCRRASASARSSARC